METLLTFSDAHTLHLLKSVDPLWRQRARQTLCGDEWQEKQPFDVAWAAEKGLFCATSVDLSRKLRGPQDVAKLCEALPHCKHLQNLKCAVAPPSQPS